MGRIDCPLCLSAAALFFTDEKSRQNYFLCPVCDLRFVDPAHHLPPDEEIERYRLHDNDVEAPHYQEFVSPLVNAIRESRPLTDLGLDFGCGGDPILYSQLSKAGFTMAKYDLYFTPGSNALKHTYDFVVASEVVEHFYRPAEEFARLRALLRPGGVLGLMTLLVTPSLDFADWFYRRDPTHVVFYSAKTFDWIQRQFQLKRVDLREPRTILLNL